MPPLRRAHLALSAALLAVVALARPAAQQPPQIGIAAVTLSDTPAVFDTAEQHRIRVVVVARGLPHPFSLAFLPDGDALITERGGRLRRVRGASISDEAPPRILLGAAPARVGRTLPRMVLSRMAGRRY